MAALHNRNLAGQSGGNTQVSLEARLVRAKKLLVHIIQGPLLTYSNSNTLPLASSFCPIDLLRRFGKTMGDHNIYKDWLSNFQLTPIHTSFKQRQDYGRSHDSLRGAKGRCNVREEIPRTLSQEISVELPRELQKKLGEHHEDRTTTRPSNDRQAHDGALDDRSISIRHSTIAASEFHKQDRRGRDKRRMSHWQRHELPLQDDVASSPEHRLSQGKTGRGPTRDRLLGGKIFTTEQKHPKLKHHPDANGRTFLSSYHDRAANPMSVGLTPRSLRSYHHAGSGLALLEAASPSLRRSPTQAYLVAWYDDWRTIVEKYRWTPADYTGTALYNEESISAPREVHEIHDYLADISPFTISCRIYFGESVRITNRLPDNKINFLRNEAIKEVNERLASQKALALDTVAIVAHFVASSWADGDKRVLRIHLKGLLTMIVMLGGLENLGPIRTLVFWILSLCMLEFLDDFGITSYSYLLASVQDSRVIMDDAMSLEQNFAVNSCKNPAGRYGLHPLKLDIQPRNSGLNDRQLRHHLGISIGNPIHSILFCLTALDDTCNRLAEFAITPGQSIRSIRLLQNYLKGRGETRANHQLPHPPFSLKDAEWHDLAIEAARSIALVLTTYALHRLIATTTSLQDLQQANEVLWASDFPSVFATEHWIMYTWVLFVAVPLAPVNARRTEAISDLVMFCQRLQLTNWARVRVFLKTYFYSAWLLDKCCHQLWLQIEGQITSHEINYGVVILTGGDVHATH